MPASQELNALSKAFCRSTDISKLPEMSFPLIRNGLCTGPPELPSKQITSSGAPVALTKDASPEGTHRVILVEGKIRLNSLIAGTLITVSPTQFVPLTTIREGSSGGLTLEVILNSMGGDNGRSYFSLAVPALSLKFAMHPKTLLRVFPQPRLKHLMKTLGIDD